MYASGLVADSSEEVNIVLCLTFFVPQFFPELRCYDAFGYEFLSSSMCARVIYAMPLALDAVAVVGARRGQVNSFISFLFIILFSCSFLSKPS